jgi:hypothetical protein
MKFHKLIVFCFFNTFFSFAQTPDSTSLTSHISHLTSQISNLTSPRYTSVHYRGNATLNIDAQTHECQFTIVNVIDSFLYIQLNFGPLEVGRVLTTPDNIVFINKLQKNYYNGDYSFIEKILGVELDFFTVQGIFNGSLTEEPEAFELSYQRDSLSYEYPFFNTLFCEYYTLSLELDVKKATFNAAPNVSATIPKNYKVIEVGCKK